ncbi:MAG: hypothetical protein CMD68_00105 [Gammaproteobacteria bacterium]|nr:hypothetical protein [Gammaproteobacteria bacterium]
MVFMPVLASTGSTDVNFGSRIKEFRLENGLKVILIEDKRTDNVISSIWYKVGSSYETSGITGISHLLEHMMFKATKSTKSGEFSAEIKKIGGSENAFTGRDFTGYYQKIDKQYLLMCLKYEADRMSNLQFNLDELKSEREVVKEERRLRTEDQPFSIVFEKIGLSILGMTGYGIPIIGTMDDLTNINISDLDYWYKRFYNPSNATLIIAGNYDEIETIEAIKNFFGPIGTIESNLNKYKYPQFDISYEKIIVNERLPNSTLILSFIKPKFTDLPRKKAYAIDLLFEVLDGSFSSRFTENIVDKKIALNTFISHDLYAKEKNIISIGGTPRKNVTLKQLEEALLYEINSIIKNGLGDNELSDTKSRIISKNIYRFDSIFTQAMIVGRLEAKNISWEILDSYIKDIDSIEDKDIIEAAEYIMSKSMQVTVVQPKK